MMKIDDTLLIMGCIFKFHAEIGVHISNRSYPSCIEYMLRVLLQVLRLLTLNVCCKLHDHDTYYYHYIEPYKKLHSKEL